MSISLEEYRKQVISEEYADYIGDLQVNALYNQEIAENYCSQRISERFVIIYEPLVEDAVWTDSYAAVPKCYGLMDVESLNVAGILKMQQYPGLELTGKDVILGFLDTGIDYRSPVFRNEDGSSRIVGIWDQTDQSGTVPEGFLYGSEYTKEKIDAALKSEAPLLIVPETDENGHGTAVAAIAAGSEAAVTAGSGTGGAATAAGNEATGAAPAADIAVVKLKSAKQYLRDFYCIRPDADAYQENDIMLGILYLQRLSYRLNKPLVICLALGTSQGDHAGNSPLGMLLNQFCMLRNHVVVTGTGNEANAGHHYQGYFNQNEEYQDIELRVGEGVEGFCMELWSTAPALYTVSVLSPSGERLPRIPVGLSSREEYRFLFEQTTVQIAYRTPESESGDNMVFFRFEAPAAGIWSIRIYPVRVGDGSFHIWLPIKAFLSGETYFLRSSPDMTLTEPSAAGRVLSIGAYDAQTDGIDIDSGRGPGRKGAVKPDLCAPGVNVLTVQPDSRNSRIAAVQPDSRNSRIAVAQPEASDDGTGQTETSLPTQDVRYVRRTGTSMAAGIAAGAAALLLEWNRDYRGGSMINTSEIREIFISGASHRVGTDYPNNECGYGRLNLYKSFEEMRLR